MTLKPMVFVLVTGVLSSCGTVGPNFLRPEVQLTDRFALAPEAPLRQAADDTWWRGLHDPVLNGLVERALAQNLDLQTARARILEAQALVRTTAPISRADGTATARADSTWVDGARTDTSSASATAGYTFDLWGERRRRQEQAEANLQAAIYDAAAARLAIQTAVVSTYVDARYFQRAAVLRRQSIGNRSRIVGVLRERNRIGDETALALRRAEAELALQRAELPDLEAGLQTSAFALATLLSAPGDQVLGLLTAKPEGQPMPRGGLNADIPAALLHNRPDIRASEARLAAAVAEVGVLEAQLYPSLRIGGSVTLSATDSVTLGPALSLPIFDHALRKARRDAARARVTAAETTWRKTVLDAVEEVQSGLARAYSWDRQVSALGSALDKYRDAASLSREAFGLSAITLLEILDAEDNLTSVSLRLANAKRNYAISWAGLNSAIGQGWNAGQGAGAVVVAAK